MSIFAYILHHIRTIRQQDPILKPPSPTQKPYSRKTSTSHRLKQQNHQPKFLVLFFGGIVTLTTLGSGLFGFPGDIGPKEPLFTQGHPPRKVSREQAVQQSLGPPKPSEGDDIPTSTPGHLPSLPIKPSRQKTELGTKAPISRATGNEVISKRKTAPQTPNLRDDDRKLTQGSSFVRKRLFREAIEVLEPLFASPPQEWEAWFWMGTAQMGLGHFDQAREYFQKGLARDETIAELWVQYALAEHQRGRYAQALNLLRQAELLAPTLPQVQLNLAFTLESQGNTSSALHHYRKYLSVTHHNSLYLSTRKKVLDRILHLDGS